MKRIALLVASSEYEDLQFKRLRAPAQDVDALQRVLADPAIGGFEVHTLINEQSPRVSEEIERFFADRKRDDVLLLYFSCHGIKDPGGRLYFAATNTKMNVLDSTGISSRWVDEQMSRSRSQRILLLLDCCYSGAFAKGMVPRSPAHVQIVERFNGLGRAVITASDAMEYAYEDDTLTPTDSVQPSVFTRAVVCGLETGEADRDGDGCVTFDELYDYVYEKVRATTSSMTPTKSVQRLRGRFCLAKNPHPPLALPSELRQAAESELAWQRVGAVDGLQRLSAEDPRGGMIRTAKRTLTHLRDDDPDPDVRAAAAKALGQPKTLDGSQQQPPPTHRPPVVVGMAAVIMVASLIAVMQFWPPNLSAKPKVADEVLTFGLLLPESGPLAPQGRRMITGAQLAFNSINDAGGIPGMEFIHLRNYDSGDPSTKTGSESAVALLSTSVDVIIGAGTSGVTLNVIDEITGAGAILFSPSNTSPHLTTHPDHGLYFRAAASDILQALVLGELVAMEDNRTAVVVFRDDAYGRPLSENTAKAFEATGGRTLAKLSYQPNTLNDGEVTKVVQEIVSADPDAVVLIGYNETEQILDAMIAQGVSPRNKNVYGADGNMNSTLNLTDRSALEGMKGTTLATGDDAFFMRLKELVPSLQDRTYAAEAYDTVIVAALAAAKAGTDAPSDIAKQINDVTRGGTKCTTFAECMTLVNERKDIDYDGISGRLEFTDVGEPGVGSYTIVEFQADGTLKPLRDVEQGP